MVALGARASDYSSVATQYDVLPRAAVFSKSDVEDFARCRNETDVALNLIDTGRILWITIFGLSLC